MKKVSLPATSKRVRPRASIAAVARKPAARRRMTRDERAAQIMAGAISFFAEHGIEGQTRDLASRLGVTHALLYRYFPTKQALIERVYHEVFLGRWKDEWEVLLADSRLSFAERVELFYLDYARVILNKDAVRIFVFSGLTHSTIPKRFLTRIVDRIFIPLMREMRAMLKLPGLDTIPATDAEKEMLWHLHGGIFYIGIRHWIYGLPFPVDLDEAVRVRTDGYVSAAPGIVRAAVMRASPPSRKSPMPGTSSRRRAGPR